MISYLWALLLMGVTFYTASIYGSTTVALLGYVQAFLMLLSFPYLLYEKRSLKVALELSAAMADQGQPVLVRVRGRMRYRGCYGSMRVRVAVRRQDGGSRKKWLRAETSGNGAVREAESLMTAKQALCYEIRLDRLRIYDMTGLFYLDCSGLARGERASLTVLPRICPVGIRLSEAVMHFAGDAEVYDALHSGEDAGEVHNLRPFQNGDKLRNVHWKISAKSQELIVRENGRPKGCPVVLLVEAAGGIREAQLQCAASISFTLMDLGCPHYVAWLSRQWQDVVRIRVDDEESYYESLLELLQDGKSSSAADIRARYQEKYSGEPPLHTIRVGSEPSIGVDAQEVRRLNASVLEKALGEMELQL